MENTIQINSFWNKNTTNIDLNLSNHKLKSSQLRRLVVLSKKQVNKIKESKAALQRASGFSYSNFNRDLDNLNSRININVKYNDRKQIEGAKLHNKGESFVSFPTFHLESKNHKVNSCAIDLLFHLNYISMNKNKISLQGVTLIQRGLNTTLKKILGKFSRQYSYEEVRKAIKLLKNYGIIKVTYARDLFDKITHKFKLRVRVTFSKALAETALNQILDPKNKGRSKEPPIKPSTSISHNINQKDNDICCESMSICLNSPCLLKGAKSNELFPEVEKVIDNKEVKPIDDSNNLDWINDIIKQK